MAIRRAEANWKLLSLAPEEDIIYLLPPPFHSVREKSKHNPYWNSPMADPIGVDSSGLGGSLQGAFEGDAGAAP